MNGFSKRLWLTKSKLRFLLTPRAKRIRLEIADDGRQLTFLLVSLHALGYALHIVESPMIFRELLNLRKSAPLPFIFGGRDRQCDLVMSDRSDVVESALKAGVLGVYLDSDFFSKGREEPRMPYFMHPSVYHRGLDRMPVPPVDRSRSTKIGFFGTRDAEFYTKKFHFPLMNREQILSLFIGQYGDKITEATLPVASWGRQEIVTSIDTSGGEDRVRETRSFLPQQAYLEALRSCDFFLSPPGWCMPLSHNLIEGMAAGSIPIVNCAEYLNPSLTHGVNCLTFTDKESLKRVVEEALAMPSAEIKRMRTYVAKYYNEHLEQGGWLEKAIEQGHDTIIVNAEERSIK